MNGPFDRFLRPMGPLGDLLRRELQPGEEASVLSEEHKLGTEVDADLFKRLPDGSIAFEERVHLNPDDLTPR